MRKSCISRAFLKSTILKKIFFLKSTILNVKIFLLSMILNEKVSLKGVISNLKYSVLSDIELKLFGLVRFRIKFLQRVRL